MYVPWGSNFLPFDRFVSYKLTFSSKFQFQYCRYTYWMSQASHTVEKWPQPSLRITWYLPLKKSPIFTWWYPPVPGKMELHSCINPWIGLKRCYYPCSSHWGLPAHHHQSPGSLLPALEEENQHGLTESHLPDCVGLACWEEGGKEPS